MSTLLSVSIAALAGLLMTRVFNLWRLPDVTAYLVAGVLIGPYVLGSMHITGLGLVSADAVSSLQLVSEVALGFIAFSIGNEFRLEDLKSTGNQAAVIGVVQALTATLLVDAALLTVHMLLPEKLSAAQAITLGAIATATAPAATLMVVRQYKAKGPVTNLLLPIVALDDAVGLIVFAVSFGISKALVSGELDLISILLCGNFLASVMQQKTPREAGFTSLGGAAGMLLGVWLNNAIFKEKRTEITEACVTALPLIYSIAKLGCLFGGCCEGLPYTGPFAVRYLRNGQTVQADSIPVQLIETVVFLLLFFSFLRCKNKMNLFALIFRR